MTPLQLALMGKGRFPNTLRVSYSNRWLGATEGHKNWPFDAKQVEENKRLYPHLFRDNKEG